MIRAWFPTAFVVTLLAAGCATKSDLLILEADRQATKSTEVDLWMTAVELAGANARWHPGREVDRIEAQDGDGETETVNEYVFRIRPGENGVEVRELISATKDGEDITAETRQKQEEVKKKREAAKVKAEEEGKTIQVQLYVEHPFAPDAQDSVQVERMQETRQIGGKDCAGFRYRFDHSGEAFTSGVAWLEASSGVPLEIEFTQRPLPPYTKDMSTVIRFERTPEGAWRKREMSTRAKVGFLFFTKHLVTMTTYDESWEQEQLESGP